MTWETAWTTVEQQTGLGKRDGQQTLGQQIHDTVFNGGQLVAEAPTGTGKSLAALIPLIEAFKQKKQRSILTTETLSLLDQIVDKDLPLLHKIFGPFSYFGLKGRNHYFCLAKSGTQHPIALAVRSRLEDTLGERRDVERLLGHRLSDDEWSEVCGEVENCAQSECKADHCWAARARAKAEAADIVITSHRMLQIHGEFIRRGDDGGLLGEFHHIVVDEAHSLEQVVVDGLTLEVSPWELYTKLNSLQKAVEILSQVTGNIPDRLLSNIDLNTREIIKEFREKFIEAMGSQSISEFSRESILFQQFPGDPEFFQMIEDTIQDYTSFGKWLAQELEDSGLKKGKGKVNKAIAACASMAQLFWLIYEAAKGDGTVEAYATTYGVFLDGIKSKDRNGRDQKDIRIRAVPMDVSQFLRGSLWKEARSVILMSATLRDYSDFSFRFLKRSLGLDRDCPELVVPTPFNLADQQLIYITPGIYSDHAGVAGSKYSPQEMRKLIDASDGKALVLFTALAEMDAAATNLRAAQDFNHKLLVQEKGVDRTALAEEFRTDINSVLLASKSFFTGLDVQGSALTSLIMAKYSLPQYNATTKTLIKFWRGNGFPNWYESKSAETFVQAFGRLIRSDECRGVVALLDHRASNPDEKVYQTVHKVVSNVYSGVEITSDINRVREWLGSGTTTNVQ
jgi:ATP-dependent DNA helicase DinG